jgi:hypothetical protein
VAAIRTLEDFYIEWRRPNALGIIKLYKDITDRDVWDAATKAAEEKFTAEHNVPALAPTTRPAVKLPSTEDVWNYVYNHHEFCEDFARENEARDISKLVYEFIYRQLQA